jgi:hypothetical protein
MVGNLLLRHFDHGGPASPHVDSRERLKTALDSLLKLQRRRGQDETSKLDESIVKIKQEIEILVRLQPELVATTDCVGENLVQFVCQNICIGLSLDLIILFAEQCPDVLRLTNNNRDTPVQLH